MIDGAGHGDLYWFQTPVINLIVNWFKENLGMPKGILNRGLELSKQKGSNT